MSRRNFAISPRGSYGVCLSTGGGESALERWELGDGHPRFVTCNTAGRAVGHAQPVVSEHGAVLVSAPVADCCELTHFDPVLAPRLLERFPQTGLHLLAGPGTDHAVALGFGHADGRTRVWRISGSPPSLSPVVADARGLLRAAGWLDRAGRLLAVNQTVDGETRVAVIDLATGSLSPWPVPGAHAILTRPGTRELLVAVQRDGGGELALVSENGDRRVLGGLSAIAGALAPLAFDRGGGRLAVVATRGARSHLFEYDLATELAREIPTSPGVIRSPAVWSADRLQVTFSAPRHPTGFAGLPDRPLTWQDPEPLRPAVAAHAEWLAGPSGPIEAVIYGGPGWRYAQRLLIAVHGGPEASWQLDFEPLFQRLAAAGVTVVAPNQRGSTGYGSGHRLAIQNAWGGPDLDDIAALGRQLADQRDAVGLEAPMLYGTSYGGFLALLSASCQPTAWSRCVAVSAFLSGPSLHEDGGGSVRRLVERLGGHTLIEDELGPRDVADLCAGMRAPLLLVHGERDPLIPVGHARRLCSRLLAHGRRAGVEFAYHEVPGAGHSPLDGRAGEPVRDQIVRFLTTDARPEPELVPAVGAEPST
jgi:pimeloyl-ACP methyl ester carboxylesterase